MALKRLVFVLTALSLAAACCAAMKPVGFKCEEDVRPGSNVASCTVEQFENVAEAVEKGYAANRVYNLWDESFNNDLLADFASIYSGIINDADGYQLLFASDIDFGNSQFASGVCENKFVPLDFSSVSDGVAIDGLDHTIRNFCYVSDNGNASFFKELNYSSISNLNFDGAYVKGAGSGASVGVLADEMNFGGIFDVSVTNAIVISTENAGGLVGEALGVAKFSGNKVQALLEGDKVGGLAGYHAKSTMNQFAPVIENNQVDIFAKTVLDDGKELCVGGLLGLLNANPVNPANGDEIVVSENAVKLDVQSVAEVALGSSSFLVGGLAGSIYTNQNVRLVKNTVDSVKVKYRGQTSGKGFVHVGGEVGFLSSDGNESGLNLSVSKDVATAYMDIDLNKASYSKNKVESQSLGGVIGLLKWGLQGSVAFNENVVSAVIDSKAESREDTVYMGGLIARVIELNGSPYGMNISSTGDTLTLSMKSAVQGFAFAGGVFGGVYLRGQNSLSNPAGAVSVSRPVIQAVEGEKLIELSSLTRVNYPYVGGVLGELFANESDCDIRGALVRGDIEIATKNVGDANVGGIAGKITAYNGYIGENVSEGNVGASVGNVGYIVGGYSDGFQSSGGTNYNGLNLIANYHYGQNDANVRNAIGLLEHDGSNIPMSIHYNYRNALEGLDADGTLDTLKEGMVKNERGIDLDTGVISESDMKSRLFAYVMNLVHKPYSLGDYWETSENGLPNVSFKQTVYRVMIDVEDITSDVLNNDAAKPYLAYDKEKAKHYLVEFTDKDGYVHGLASLMPSLGYGVTTKQGQLARLDAPFVNDDALKTAEDRKIKVIYETRQGEPIETYMWPMVEEVSLFYAKEAIPAILVNKNGTLQEYFAYKAYMECIDKCNAAFSDSMLFSSNIVYNFGPLMRAVANLEYSELKNEIHLVYAPLEYTPTMYLESNGANSSVNVVMYGRDESGNLVAMDTLSVAGNGGIDRRLKVASKFGAVAEWGYELKNWKVDFWIWNGTDRSDLLQAQNDCNGSTVICDEFTMTSNSFGNVDDIVKELSPYDELRTTAPSITVVQKRSFDLDASETLNMDSLIYAVSYYYPQAQKSGLFETVKFLADVTLDLEPIPYNVTFDLNAGSYEVFIPEGFAVTGEYKRGDPSTETFPKLYSKEGCFDGWGGKADSAKVVQGRLDKTLLESIKPTGEDLYLYAQWRPCTKPIETTSLTPIAQDKNAEIGDFGEVSFWQSYVDANSETVRIDHGMDSGYLVIPAAAEPMRFHVSAVPKEGFSLAKLFLVWEKFDPNSGILLESDSSQQTFFVNDTTISFMPSSYVSYKLYAIFGHYYNAAFQLKRGRDGVFFGMNSDADSVMVVEGSWVDLPRTIYTADSCVLGWSVERDAKNWEYRDYVDADSIYEKLEPTKALYAVWADAQTCVDSLGYQLVKLKTEHGMVQFLEQAFNADSTQYLHKFAEDSTMLLPEKLMDGYWIVRAAPEPGYALDSLVVQVLDDQYNDSTGLYEEVEKRVVFMAGDTLHSHVRYVSMQAFFSESNGSADGPFQIVNANLRQSGNSGAAVHLDFETNPFNVSLDVSVNVSLLDVNGVLLREYDPVHVDETPYYGSWKEYPLTPGTYVLHVTLANDQYTVAFDTSFTVASEIEVAANTWYMVSLGSVDMESVVWDDDPVFYWWDEFSIGGDFWQYNALKSGNKIDERERGYWYSSLEGRPLKLAVDTANFDSEVHWQIDSAYSGWNLVANPYGWSVSIYNTEGLGFNNDPFCYNDRRGNHKDKDGEPEWSEIAFWKYDPASGNYALADTIGPYEGVWVKTGCSKEWRFNAEPVFPELRQDDNEGLLKAAKKPVLAKAVAKDSWTLQAKLGDGKGKVDSWNVLGVGTKNVVIAEPPEAMGDHVNLSVVDGKRHLAKSVKAGVAAPEWKVELSASSNRVGYLSFEGVDALREYGLKVFVTVDGKTTEMREGEPLKVALTRTAKYATVRVAESAKVELAYRLDGVRAFQVGHGLQVSFTATDGLAGSAVQVDLIDLKGHVAAKASGKAQIGTNTLSLDVPKTGVYMLRVRAGSQVQTGRIMVK
jgi:hypothetical protein